MRLLPRRRKGGHSVSLTKTEVSQDCKKAKVEANAAGRRLQEAKAQWPEVIAKAGSLANIRQRNHFAEMIREAVMGADRDTRTDS